MSNPSFPHLWGENCKSGHDEQWTLKEYIRYVYQSLMPRRLHVQIVSMPFLSGVQKSVNRNGVIQVQMNPTKQILMSWNVWIWAWEWVRIGNQWIIFDIWSKFNSRILIFNLTSTIVRKCLLLSLNTWLCCMIVASAAVGQSTKPKRQSFLATCDLYFNSFRI